jgi:hypothetical protein
MKKSEIKRKLQKVVSVMIVWPLFQQAIDMWSWVWGRGAYPNRFCDFFIIGNTSFLLCFVENSAWLFVNTLKN